VVAVNRARRSRPLGCAVIGLRPLRARGAADAKTKAPGVVERFAFAVTSVTIGGDTMALEMVGREEELASVCAFIDQAGEGPAALVLEGEAGIGKSTLWLAGAAYARTGGMRVLGSRPAEAERGLTHAGLGDLFDGAVDDILPELPPPRRRALEIALLRSEAAHDPVDHRALAVAVHDVLHLLGKRTPVLVAVDDVQWLDSSSASALGFALRRLDGSRVRLLLARRLDAVELEQVLDVQLLRIGPLSVGALHRLLHDRLGRPFPRQTMLRIHERSGGNPFFALELARSLDAAVGPLEPLPVPTTLDELLRARLAGLPAETHDALALASALGTPSEALLKRVGVAPNALDAAIAAGVVEREHGAVRFTHPLLSSLLYNDLGPRRQVVHERIAAVVDDPVTRARHLALATNEPDAGIAADLDDAVHVAAERGAAAAAAELAEAALRLTPPAEREERQRRALAAARAHQAGGEWTRAKAIANDLLEDSDIGALRADVLLLLAELESLDRATALLEEALHEASSRPALQAAIQRRLAWTARFTKGFDGAFEHARRSLELADKVDDDMLRLDALEMMVFLGSAIGDPQARAYATRAVEIARALGDARRVQRARLTLCDAVAASSERRAARALLERMYEDCRERDELAAAEALHGLAWAELWAGRWELAADYAERAYDLMTQYGLEVPWAHLPIAVVAAHRGRLELARAHSERSLQLGEEQFGRHTPVHVGTLGFIARQSGDLEAALRWFVEGEAVTTGLGWRDAGRRWWVGDHVEVLLELDRVDEAVRVLDAWEDERKPDDDWSLGHVTRCRGLVEAARGDVSRAAAILEDAIAQHEAAQDAFGSARAMLALGVVRRRERQKRAAREAIEAALAGFEQLGAATWIAKARAELGRIGGRTREQGLTAAERRVAALVAEGRTNREVAAALFLGERTVETHLSHVYTKLGVRSRAELARIYRPDSGAAEQSSGGLTISS
jgi:DNA-binding CsgD family transcriptional regulator